MSTAKFKTGDEVIIARPGANPQMRGLKVTLLSGKRKCLTEDKQWARGYLFTVDGKPFVAVESELEPA